jgi:hypothetical protein
MSNKVNKHGKQTSAANAFGAGSDLVGKEFRGKEIISATRQYMTTSDGATHPRKGNHIQHEPAILPAGYVPDNDAYMTDDL